MYDEETSDLATACIHPDRHHRYSHERVVKRKKKDREEDTTFIPPGVVKTVVGKGEAIHVSVGHCWIMTGIVGSGRVK